MVGGTPWSIWKIPPLIFYNSPQITKSRYSRNTKKDFVERKGKSFTIWEVADASFFKVD